MFFFKYVQRYIVVLSHRKNFSFYNVLYYCEYLYILHILLLIARFIYIYYIEEEVTNEMCQDSKNSNDFL